MKKIPTLFVRDQQDRSKITTQITPGCEWVIEGHGVATRKYDGTCVMQDADNAWWARREVKKNKTPPPNWVEEDCDPITGKRQGWEPIIQSGYLEPFLGALALSGPHAKPGTYELIGPKVNGNPERINGRHHLIRHELAVAVPARIVAGIFTAGRTLDAVNMVRFYGQEGWEGIVWHGGPDGQMVKLKAKDIR